jgi:hypothetical protein
MTLTMAAAIAVATMSAQGAKTYSGRLSPVPIDVPLQATVAGSGSVTATLTGNRLTVDGKFEGLRSPATVARLHIGRKGVRGPSVSDLMVSPAIAGSVTGRVDLTPQQIQALQSGWVYIQVHSEKAPDGNLWGWLLVPEPRR